MKELTKKQKIGMLILALIVVVGTAIIFTIGFHFDLKFQETKKVELYLGKEFEIADIKTITDEVIPNQPVILQKVEVYQDTVSIMAKEITEEQKQNLITKVNEKYQTEITEEGTVIQTIPHTKGKDLVKPYLIPFAIATIISLVYIVVRYRKLGMIKNMIATIVVLVLTQVVLFSVIAITRIPVGRITMPTSIVVYLLTLMGINNQLENKLKIEKEKETK